MRPLYGVFGLLGTWSDWWRFFDDDRAGLIQSFLALLLVFPSLWLVVTGVEAERAAILGNDRPELSVSLYALVISFWLLSFHITSGIIAVLMMRTDSLRLWWIARNWAVVWLCLAIGLVSLAVRLGLPFVIANGALFAAYLGLLPIDIRIAQRVTGLPIGTAILVGCIIVSTSMMILLMGILQGLQ